ncbi:MAG: hypothetical protein GXO14_02850 [Thermococci archaeon]|nr:hypothetical protein [Thermococci archaeon]
MNRKRKAYLISSLFFFFVAFIVISYPIANFYLTKYIGSSHKVSRGEFVYVGWIPAFYSGQFLYVYRFRGLGNGKFDLNATLYRYVPFVTPRKTTFVTKFHPGPPATAKNGIPYSYYKHGKVTRVYSAHLVLNSSDPIIRLFFPKVSDPYIRMTVELFKLNGTNALDSGVIMPNKTFRIVTPSYEFDFKDRWLPQFLGFPRVYMPNFTLNEFPKMTASFSPIDYFKGSDRYFVRSVLLSPELVAGIPPYEIGFARVFNFSDVNKIMYGFDAYGQMSFPMTLVRTNITPVSQDWAWAFKYSFRNYAAPVDYVLILIGLILLVLAGRAKG